MMMMMMMISASSFIQVFPATAGDGAQPTFIEINYAIQAHNAVSIKTKQSKPK